MYLPAICFICSTLFVKYMKGDTLRDTATACSHSLGPRLISATITVGSPVHIQTSSWDHPPTQVQPLFSLFALAEPTCMGTQTRNWKELMPASLRSRSWCISTFLTCCQCTILEAFCTLLRKFQQN